MERGDGIKIKIFQEVRKRLLESGYLVYKPEEWKFYYKKRNIVVVIFPTIRFFENEDIPRAHLLVWVYKKGKLIDHRLIYNDGIEEFFHYLYTQEGFI